MADILFQSSSALFWENRSRPRCSYCMQPAVSACNFQLRTGLFGFRGCGKAFCEVHGRCHQIDKDASQDNLLKNNSLSQVKQETQPYRSEPSFSKFYLVYVAKEDPAYFRSCEHCLLYWKLAMSRVKFVLQAGILLLMLLVVQILFSRGLSTASRDLCYGDRIQSIALGKCFIRRNWDYNLQFASFRTGGSCKIKGFDHELEAVQCECQDYFKYSRSRNECVRQKCLATQKSGACLDPTRVKMQKSPDLKRNGTCPIFRKYIDAYKGCVQLSCPHSFKLTIDGNCEQCPPYYRGTVSACRHFSALEKKSSKWATLPHLKLIECERTKEGELIPFLDSLGNLQCSAGNRSNRPCQPHEVLRKTQIRCSFSCPPYQHFDILSKTCKRRTCNLNSFLLESGECYLCSLLYSKPSTYLQLSPQNQKCFDLQLEVWPESKYLEP